MKGIRAALEAAYLVYYKFWWENGLNKLLQPVPGRNLKYLPKEHIHSLQLPKLLYSEPVLLIREEYELAFTYLQSQEGEEQRIRSGGMVITGQPGIGEHLSPSAISFANNRLILEHPIQGSPTSYTISCFAS
jgi:hypothetical protein